MMDEQLIEEVAQHGVIYNRQKYYLNNSSCTVAVGGMPQGKYETKEDAWQVIAMKLRTDVETCKKRWKYLRERYVSQRKQGDPPVYEHLSRPYLEKMKFLDQHIQPRKSYRNVPNFLTSPTSTNSSNYIEYNLDPSKSNSSVKGGMQHYSSYPDQQTVNSLHASGANITADNCNSLIKTETDQAFRDFAATVASQQLQHIAQPPSAPSQHHTVNAASVTSIPSSSQNFDENLRENNVAGKGSGAAVSSTSSSTKSPLSSPLPISHGNSISQSSNNQSSCNAPSNHAYQPVNLELSLNNGYNLKKPRVQIPSQHISIPANNNSSAPNSTFVNDSDDDSDDNVNLLQTFNDHQENHYNAGPSLPRNLPNNGNMQQQQGMLSTNADFFFQLYQQLPHSQQHAEAANSHQQHIKKFQMLQSSIQRSSEHLLGELVTTELLKMTKEKRKNVQKRILEILFFDD